VYKNDQTVIHHYAMFPLPHPTNIIQTWLILLR